MSIKIRPIKPDDYPLLRDFLYLAIFAPPSEEKPSFDITFKPEIDVYIKDFGGKDDCGVVAEVDGKVVGIAWTRIIDAYGHIDGATPELAISVLPEYRGKGIGTMMMESLFMLLCKGGFKHTSLSVTKTNPAVRFYSRLGYKIESEKADHVGHDDYIMVKQLG